MMRRTDENQFKKYLVSTLLKGYGHIQSHEDKYSTGIPDLDYCFNSAAGWCELKIIREWPKKADTNLHGALKHLTNDQCNWLKKRRNAGGRAFILLKVMSTKEYLLFDGKDARKLKGCTQLEACGLSLSMWGGSLPAKELIEELTRC
jgi:hypothetical protein